MNKRNKTSKKFSKKQMKSAPGLKQYLLNYYDSVFTGTLYMGSSRLEMDNILFDTGSGALTL